MSDKEILVNRIKRVPRRAWAKPIKVARRKYKSRNEAAAEFGIHVATFNSRLSRGWKPEEAAGLKERQKSSKHGKTVRIRGITYPNISDAAHAHSIKPTQVFSRMSIGWSLEEALGMVKRNRPKGAKNNPLWKKVVVDGVQYRSIRAAAKVYGVPYNAVYKRVKMGWPIEKAVKEPMRCKRQ